MPSFVNRRAEDVIRNDEYTDIFSFNLNENYSDDVPIGVVISQTPVSERQISAPLPGGTISVTLDVSLGPPPPTIMPDLLGQHWGVARNSLIDRNLNLLIEPVEVASDTQPGLVIETIPDAGETLARGHTVILRFSGGPNIPMLTVPNLELPATLAEVNSAFRGLDLRLEFDEFYSNTHPIDTVTYIRFSGEDVAAGSVIIVSISLGPDEPDEPEEPDEPDEPEDPDESEYPDSGDTQDPDINGSEFPAYPPIEVYPPVTYPPGQVYPPLVPDDPLDDIFIPAEPS